MSQHTSDADLRETLEDNKDRYLRAVDAVGSLEAEAFIFETGRLPIEPFDTGIIGIAADLPVQLEDVIAEVVFFGEFLLQVIEVHNNIRRPLEAVHRTTHFGAPGPVSFRGRSAQCYATIAVDLSLQCMSHAPSWILGSKKASLVREVVTRAMEENRWPMRVDSNDPLSFVYDFDWSKYISWIVSNSRAAYDRPDDSWHLHRLYALVEWEFSCALSDLDPPPPDHSVTVDHERSKIIVDGEKHDAKLEWCSIIRALIDADTNYVTGPDMRELRGCKGKKIWKEIKELEQAIPSLKSYLKHEGNRGWRLLKGV